jgi:uncharacterized protein YPO0396
MYAIRKPTGECNEIEIVLEDIPDRINMLRQLAGSLSNFNDRPTRLLFVCSTVGYGTLLVP